MKVGVVGAGAWGTTIAIHLAGKGNDVVLWARDEDDPARMEASRFNETYLPGARFPDSLHVGVIGEADFLVNGVPTQFIRGVYERLDLPRAPLVSLSKGIEIATGKLGTRIIEDVMGAGFETAVLTGPCIAREVVRGRPTAVVVAGARAEMFQQAFHDDRFRVYTSDDKLGAELCGALKNVMGIAAGIIDGMELGDNTKAAMLTRGIVEMGRLGEALGAQPGTFSGLAGFGDLFTTCVSPYGRNRTCGERIGRGETLAEIQGSQAAVVEGVPTTRAVIALAQKTGVEMPITSALHAILYERVSVEDAIGDLMARARRPES